MMITYLDHPSPVHTSIGTPTHTHTHTHTRTHALTESQRCISIMFSAVLLIAAAAAGNSENVTVCGSNATICPDSFSYTGKGCCVLGSNAQCCQTPLAPGNGRVRNYCCPEGSQCSPGGCTPVKHVYPCGTEQGENCSVSYVCHPGPQPWEPTPGVSNIMVIGDSVSRGWTPRLARLAHGSYVTHDPYSGDGGARSTSDMLQCWKYRVHTAALTPLPLTANDTVLFNFGLHDYNLGLAGADQYEADLTNITAGLQSTLAARLVYILTTPSHQNTEEDATVQILNERAMKVMKTAKVPVIDMYTPLIKECGAVPWADSGPTACKLCAPECQKLHVHYTPAGYEFIAKRVLAALAPSPSPPPPPPPSPPNCLSDLDCSLNGDCTKGGSCSCYAGWKGSRCGWLDFKPLQNASASGFNEPNVNTWGGSIAKDASQNGMWHMYLSYMELGCTLEEFKPNSKIVHAVSNSSVGPYVYSDTVIAHWTHNPHVQVIPGTNPPLYVIYHIGNGNATYLCNCTSGSSRPAGCNAHSCPPSSCATTATMLASTSPYGPWKEFHGPYIVSSNPVKSLGVRYSNPAFHFFPNGSAILAYRQSLTRWGINSTALAEGVGLAFCPNWTGPCQDLTPKAPALNGLSNCRPADRSTGGNCEDMALWQDINGNWHMFTHHFHHYARSLTSWASSPLAEPGPAKPFDDGCDCLPLGGPRPQIVLRDSKVQLVSNGCHATDGSGRTRTWVREVNI